MRANKYYPVDLGLMNAVLTQTRPNSGKKLETVVFHQLKRKHRNVYYWKGQGEVDFVVESRQGLLPIEIKASSRARMEDIRSLEAFLDEYRSAKIGVLIYGGEQAVALTPRIVALPAKAGL